MDTQIPKSGNNDLYQLYVLYQILNCLYLAAPTCGINEVYDNCANGGCRKRTCSQPIICVRPKECEGGCICQDGYTRNDNGTCIPIDECPRKYTLNL